MGFFSYRGLPVFQITGGEDVGDWRHVRIHYHETKQHAARELVTAHAHGDEHAVDIHFDQVDFRLTEHRRKIDTDEYNHDETEIYDNRGRGKPYE